jgi:type II secretory pathway pseudopilin PulG
MTDRVRQQVFDYLLGTLDESEMEDLRARLEHDPAYRHAMRLASRDLGRLRGLKCEVPVPPRLAERTCDLVFNPRERLRRSRLRAMTAQPTTLAATGRSNWIDVAVAGVIFLIAGLLILPAINSSRYQARITACQGNMRNVGQALSEYSHRNNEVFPAVPAQGNLAADGIWAPVLKEQGFLPEPQQVLCPESPQAQQADFRIPTLDELRKAAGQELARIQQKMGGSYGYCLGYSDHGIFQPTRNLNRDYFAILADAPSDRPDHQSANHGGLGQNVLFEDLHVEFCSTTRPGNGLDDIYTNDNHEVAPGLHRDDSVIASSGTVPVVYISLP